jgi:hypothetical protein
MILDELKLLIKDLEIILIKDSRFKNDVHFKNQVRTIYMCKDKTMPINITGLYNLAMLNSSAKDITKKDTVDDIRKELQDIKKNLDIPSLNLDELKQRIDNILERTNKIKG